MQPTDRACRERFILAPLVLSRSRFPPLLFGTTIERAYVSADGARDTFYNDGDRRAASGVTSLSYHDEISRS